MGSQSITRSGDSRASFPVPWAASSSWLHSGTPAGLCFTSGWRFSTGQRFTLPPRDTERCFVQLLDWRPVAILLRCRKEAQCLVLRSGAFSVSGMPGHCGAARLCRVVSLLHTHHRESLFKTNDIFKRKTPLFHSQPVPQYFICCFWAVLMQ